MSHDQTLDKLFPPSDRFARRHLGPRAGDLVSMLKTLDAQSMDELIHQVVPDGLRSKDDLKLPPAVSETRALEELRSLADQNQVYRSYLGMGYYGTHTPTVILRNIFENPGWYTQYTPYQAEISQGRLEALLNFQTIVSDLTGMEVASASLLDEATAAAEAMTLCQRVLGRKADGRTRFFVSSDCHPQTIAVIQTRAEPLDIQVAVGHAGEVKIDETLIGAIVQYPDRKGEVCDFAGFFEELNA
ncbi:MAG: aminomethyl-transferring glycine dehydrogenase, partial [Planctomycetota bacterium]